MGAKSSATPGRVRARPKYLRKGAGGGELFEFCNDQVMMLPEGPEWWKGEGKGSDRTYL